MSLIEKKIEAARGLSKRAIRRAFGIECKLEGPTADLKALYNVALQKIFWKDMPQEKVDLLTTALSEWADIERGSNKGKVITKQLDEIREDITRFYRRLK